MALTPAYAVDGGRIDGRMFRSVLWASTSGAAGVVKASDLRVSALAVPGSKVNINPGGALLPTRFAGASSTQSYAVINDGVMQVDIPATGSSSGRTDYLIVRIDDWHFTGDQAPTDPTSAQYCSVQRVPSISGLPYPFVVLAKITLPASTGTVTNSMIKDMREVANPRTQRVLRPNAVIISETETLKSKDGEYFPNAGGSQTVPIPPWATRVKIRADWMCMLMPSGDCNGSLWVSFGDWDGKTWGASSQDFKFNNASGGDSRGNFTVVDDMPVPPNLRGRDVHFQMWAKRIGAVGAKMDAWTGVSLDLLFEEVADSSDS